MASSGSFGPGTVNVTTICKYTKDSISPGASEEISLRVLIKIKETVVESILNRGIRIMQPGSCVIR